MKKNRQIAIDIIDSTDPSVQCIHALRQIMDYFEGKCEIRGPGRSLSPMGKDRRAVIAWFNERYQMDTPIIKLDGLP